MEPKYLNDWSNFDQMANDFFSGWPEDEYEEKRNLADLDTITVLLASYGYENYSGGAFVLFSRGGELFEVNGSHCSCYGLEGQWEPERTTVEVLMHRLDSGNLGNDDYCGNVFADELRVVLDALDAQP